MLKDDYISQLSSLKVPAGDTHIEDVNAFLRFLAEARKFNNEIMVYPRQVCYRDRKARKELLKWIPVTPSTFDVAAHKDKKTEDLAYLAEHGLCTSAKKAYVQSEKCFYVMATPPNICHTKNHDFQAAAVSDEPWTDEDIKKYYKEQEDWHCVCILVHNKVVGILLCLSFGQLIIKVLDAYL